MPHSTKDTLKVYLHEADYEEDGRYTVLSAAAGTLPKFQVGLTWEEKHSWFLL